MCALALQEGVWAAAGGNGDWHSEVRDIIILHFLGGNGGGGEENGVQSFQYYMHR
jgi:hypothetical protein